MLTYGGVTLIHALLYIVVLTLCTCRLSRLVLFVTALGDVDIAMCWRSRLDFCAEIFTQRYGIMATISSVCYFDLFWNQSISLDVCNTSLVADLTVDSVGLAQSGLETPCSNILTT